MGGIKSKALRPFKGYNFEHRAQRLVKKEQESAAPKAAPKHASSQELLEKHAAGETFRFLKIISIFRSDPKGPVLGPIAQSIYLSSNTAYALTSIFGRHCASGL